MRKRFPKARRRRITAWTAFAVTWATAIVARSIGGPAGVAGAETATIPSPEPEQAVVPATTTPPATLPELPADGLVVVRYTPVERPQPEVRRVVVATPAPSPPAAPAPTTQRSSGS